MRSIAINKLNPIICALSIAVTLSGNVMAVGYTITDLGTLGGSIAVGWGISDNRYITGGSSITDPSTLRERVFILLILKYLSSRVVLMWNGQCAQMTALT